jgi:TM2 domain-containing membrane protein YozV
MKEAKMATSRTDEWKHALTVLIISFLGGYFGLDRLYRGQVGWGILKLITMGGGGIWYLVDLAIAAYRFGKA